MRTSRPTQQRLLALLAAALAVLAAMQAEAAGARTMRQQRMAAEATQRRPVVRDIVRPEALQAAAAAAAGSLPGGPGANAKEQQQQQDGSGRVDGDDKLPLPEPTHFGYLDVNREKGSNMFYMYYEAMEPAADPSTTPIVLWLQVGGRVPGAGGGGGRGSRLR